MICSNAFYLYFNMSLVHFWTMAFVCYISMYRALKSVEFLKPFEYYYFIFFWLIVCQPLKVHGFYFRSLFFVERCYIFRPHLINYTTNVWNWCTFYWVCNSNPSLSRSFFSQNKTCIELVGMNIFLYHFQCYFQKLDRQF